MMFSVLQECRMTRAAKTSQLVKQHCRRAEKAEKYKAGLVTSVLRLLKLETASADTAEPRLYDNVCNLTL